MQHSSTDNPLAPFFPIRRSALAKLSAAAEAAGVQLLPVLMVEGQESLLSVALTDLRAIGAPPHLIGSTAASQPPQQQQRQQQDGLLSLDEAAALLAAALQLPSVTVVTLPMGDMLLSAAAAAAAGSSGINGGSSGGVLRMVGGLDQQWQLLAALQRLEGQIASALQQQQQHGGVGLLSKL
jgi:hypothetical protein